MNIKNKHFIFMLQLSVANSDAYVIIPGSGNTVYGGTHLIDDYHATAAIEDATSAAVYCE